MDVLNLAYMLYLNNAYFVKICKTWILMKYCKSFVSSIKNKSKKYGKKSNILCYLTFNPRHQFSANI